MDAAESTSPMTMRTASTEPAITHWRHDAVPAFRQRFLPTVSGRPVIVAVDGRSGAGKSTLSRRLSESIDAAAVVATDDVAWNHAMFDWADELSTGVLAPLRQGQAVDYRPPGWVRKDRPGSITVPAAASVVFVEGVGASRAELAPRFDLTIWVQSDEREAFRLGIERDIRQGRSRDEAIEFWEHWMREENPFLERDQPWARADVIVAGVPLGEDDHLYWTTDRPEPGAEPTG